MADLILLGNLKGTDGAAPTDATVAPIITAGDETKAALDTTNADLVADDASSMAGAVAARIGAPTSGFMAADSGETLTPTILSYNPTSVVQKLTPTDQTWQDIDATNLVISFVCPPSGKVEIAMTSMMGMSSGSQSLFWGLRDVALNARHTDSVGIVATSSSTVGLGGSVGSRRFTLAKDGAGGALVPGKLYTFAWTQRANLATIACYTQFGGIGNSGPAQIVVTPVSNRVTAKTITAVVDPAPNWQPHAVEADGLHMIGMAGVGQAGINGRIGFSTDGGTTWTPLSNGVAPSGVSQIWYAGDGEIIVLAGITGAPNGPGSVWRSSGWSTNPSTATFAKVLQANNIGGTGTVYLANFSGINQYGNICVLNEYGPKLSGSTMGRYVYATEDHGATWRVIFDLYAYTLALFPAWNGASAHTHGAAYDPYWDCVWVTTGDYNGTEVKAPTLVSFDWRSATPTWHMVYSKHQFTSAIPMRDCILFGTDTGSSAADGLGNGFYRINRGNPATLKTGREVVLEPAFVYDANAGITVISLGSSRRKALRDSPVLISVGESGVSGPTGRILATYDGLTFKEIWTATDTGVLGSVGTVVGPVGGKIYATYQSSADTFRKELVTLTLT